MKTVLIVDDDPVAIRLIGMIVARRGFGVASATSAAEALAWLGEHHPVEVIVTDQNLGGTTGLELYAILQADARYKPLPVVLCTGTTHWQTVNEAMKLGIKHLIVKPITPTVVITKVEAAAAERPPIMQPRESIMARLLLAQAEYAGLLQVTLGHLAQLREELDRACTGRDRTAALEAVEKLGEPARLLRATRLVEAVGGVPVKAGWTGLEAPVGLALNEAVALEAALTEEIEALGPGRQLGFPGSGA